MFTPPSNGVSGWKEIAGKEEERFEGRKNPCLDSRMGGKEFGGEEIGRT